LEEAQRLLGQLVDLKIAPFYIEWLEIEPSVFCGRKVGSPGAIILMLPAVVILPDEALVAICIEGLGRY
jgi:hypothetical protein